MPCGLLKGLCAAGVVEQHILVLRSRAVGRLRGARNNVGRAALNDAAEVAEPVLRTTGRITGVKRNNPLVRQGATGIEQTKNHGTVGIVGQHHVRAVYERNSQVNVIARRPQCNRRGAEGGLNFTQDTGGAGQRQVERPGAMVEDPPARPEKNS